MTRQKDLVALIDLDGTIADYHLSMTNALREIAAPGEPAEHAWSGPGTPAWLEARCDLIKRQPGFWRDLPTIEDGLRVVGIMRELGFQLLVLSRGPKRTTSAWTEKADWCALHIPDALVTVTHIKEYTYGRVLFDDYPDYVEPWLEHRPRALVLMLEHPWNKDFTHPQVVKVPRPFLRRADFERVTEALVHARDR